MKLLAKLGLYTIACCALFSCSSSSEEQFVGTWTIDGEEEILGYNFLFQKEVLTLNEDNSFSQRFIYLDDTHIDTLAIVSVDGNWELSEGCLEMKYNPSSISIICDDEDTKDLFVENISGKINFANEELENAHKEDAQYGITNATVIDDKIISKVNPTDENGEEIYTKAK